MTDRRKQEVPKQERKKHTDAIIIKGAESWKRQNQTFVLNYFLNKISI